MDMEVECSHAAVQGVMRAEFFLGRGEGRNLPPLTAVSPL